MNSKIYLWTFNKRDASNYLSLGLLFPFIFTEIIAWKKAESQIHKLSYI